MSLKGRQTDDISAIHEEESGYLLFFIASLLQVDWKVFLSTDIDDRHKDRPIGIADRRREFVVIGR